MTGARRIPGGSGTAATPGHGGGGNGTRMLLIVLSAEASSEKVGLLPFLLNIQAH
jgi:hypothetical protein